LNFGHFSNIPPKDVLRNKWGIARPTFVHVGRLIKQKSVELIIEAFAHLCRAGIDADLLIIGDGRQRAELEALARSSQIAEKVTFTGMLHGEDLVQRIAACDVFVSASTTEVQALVFLEAMALGLPCIGVRAGGIREYVHHERNGLVVEPNNSEALASAMQALIRDTELRRMYGRNAKEQARRYDADVVLQEFERVYQQVSPS
jgi:glycosyltransferase involved in cell wall biosynthesis